jgi:hypothetical protein
MAVTFKDAEQFVTTTLTQSQKAMQSAQDYYQKRSGLVADTSKNLVEARDVMKAAGMSIPADLANFKETKKFDAQFFNAVSAYQQTLHDHNPSYYNKKTDGKWGGGTDNGHEMLMNELKQLKQMLSSEAKVEMSDSALKVAKQMYSLFESPVESNAAFSSATQGTNFMFELGGKSYSLSQAITLIRGEKDENRQNELFIDLATQISDAFRLKGGDVDKARNDFGFRYSPTQGDPAQIRETGEFSCFSGNLALASLLELVKQKSEVSADILMSNVVNLIRGGKSERGQHAIVSISTFSEISSSSQYFDVTGAGKLNETVKGKSVKSSNATYILSGEFNLTNATFKAAANLESPSVKNYVPEEIAKIESRPERLNQALIGIMSNNDEKQVLELAKMIEKDVRALVSARNADPIVISDLSAYLKVVKVLPEAEFSGRAIYVSMAFANLDQFSALFTKDEQIEDPKERKEVLSQLSEFVSSGSFKFFNPKTNDQKIYVTFLEALSLARLTKIIADIKKEYQNDTSVSSLRVATAERLQTTIDSVGLNFDKLADVRSNPFASVKKVSEPYFETPADAVVSKLAALWNTHNSIPLNVLQELFSNPEKMSDYDKYNQSDNRIAKNVRP